jgi:hypothetical protein
MRVDISADVFVTATSLRPILNLLHCFATGRHDWSTSPLVVNAARGYLRIEAPGMAATIANLGQKAIVNAAWQTPISTNIVHVKSDNLIDMVEDLCRSAVVVVEDQENDGRFIRALAYVFGITRIIDAIEKGWLVVRHSGGERLLLVAQHERRAFRRQVRIAALLDSDRLVPSARTKNHDKADQLAALGLVVHVLELREAENYVPNRVLAAAGRASEMSSKLTELKRMSDVQRGHFDMKHGFGPVNGEPIVKDEQSALFTGLDNRTLRTLRGGFGRHLLSLLEAESKRLKAKDFAGVGLGVEFELRKILVKIESVI